MTQQLRLVQCGEFLLFLPIYFSQQDFIPQLKDHLLGHLLHKPFDGDEEDFLDSDWNTIWIVDNQIYSAKVL